MILTPVVDKIRDVTETFWHRLNKTTELHTPSAGVRSRNNSPVLLVHGTVLDKESLRDYLDVVLKAGHPVDLSSYSSITNGSRLHTNAQALSRRVNANRIHATRENMKKLRSLRKKPEGLQKFFSLDDSLYGEKDPSVARITELLPGIVEKIGDILQLKKRVLLESFSGRIRKMELDLAQKIKQTGFASSTETPEKQDEICGKAASEILNSIAPRVTLVGHSLGGFTAYLMVLNRRENPDDTSEFTYDGGNGIGTILTLSSPLRGVRWPIPPMMKNAGYDMVNESFLAWLEGLPGIRHIARLPIVNGVYNFNKGIARKIAGKLSDIAMKTMSPAVYPLRPGYKELREGSDFLEKYINNRLVPYGVTVVAFISAADGICEKDRSGVDSTQPNANNVCITDDIPKTYDKPIPLLKMMLTRSIMAHLQFLVNPKKHLQEFRDAILENPERIPKVLHRSNSDSIRWGCLHLLLKKLRKDKKYLQNPEMNDVVRAVRGVAEERLPFTDSPSFLAQQILTLAEGDVKIKCVELSETGGWFVCS